ncbi:MAG: hypothetical protein AVDCRST_MAG68-588 [uncultured Gemmatimonadetes bacterium]|uniref:Flippase-like domain-containing protein n=1 Tax=uncultured Gemmatimonadota bacterium TaxID=203437 RepID=A0A6J4KD34_9BACT|nr:MAG: hypothetical protein AVDCRST_MAG68-588 [uncultured Gemmatimonadota bacterium]
MAVVLSILVIAGLVAALRRDGPAALEAWRTADVRWSWVALATALGLGGHAVAAFGWRRLLVDLGLRVQYGWVLRVFLVSNMGRYLPGGKAWQMGIVGVMSTERGLPAIVVAGSSLLHGIVGVAVGAILLLPLGGTLFGGAQALFALAAAGLASLIALPRILRLFPGVRAALAARITGIDTVSSATMWALVWTAAAGWLSWGVALYALAWALLPAPTPAIPLFIAAWIGPFLAGLLAVVSPAGVGVREGAMQAALAAVGLAPSAALLLTLASRIWVTMIEVVPAAVLLAARRGAGRDERPSPTASGR